MRRFSTLAWNGLKIALCGAVIAAIAVTFVVFGPQGEVEDAEADIFWFGPSSLQDSKHQRFVDLLDDQGFSEPQPYDWNGNILFFSHGETTESPRQVAARMQEAFLRDGINDRIFPVPPDPTALGDESATAAERAYAALAAEEFFTGGMIPIVDTGDHVAFTSVEVAAKGGNLDNLDEMFVILGLLPQHLGISSIFNNMRYVEIFRPEGSRKTQKIAVFGDEKVNFNRFQPGTGGAMPHRGADDTVPSCPGCERTSRFSGMESQDGFEMQSFDSPDTVDGVLAFYTRAMLVRGWELSSGADVTRFLDHFYPPSVMEERTGDVAVFARGSEVVHVHAYPAARGGAQVNVFQGK